MLYLLTKKVMKYSKKLIDAIVMEWQIEMKKKDIDEKMLSEITKIDYYRIKLYFNGVMDDLHLSKYLNICNALGVPPFDTIAKAKNQLKVS